MSSVGQFRKPQPPGLARVTQPRSWRLWALVMSGIALGAVSLAINRNTLFRWYYGVLPLSTLSASLEDGADPVGITVLAERYLHGNRPADAERVLLPLLERQPEHSEAWLLRSRAEFAQSKFGPAYASLQVARAGLPPDAEIRYLMGQLQERRGNENAAEREYRAAIKLNPRHLGALVKLGRIELMHLQYGGALDHFKMAGTIAPQDPEVLQLLAQTQQALGNAEAAEAASREAVAAAPASGRAWYVLGEVLKTSVDPQRRDEAAAAFRKALDLDPKLVVAHHELGMLRFQANDLPGAIREFSTVLQKLPLHKQSYPILARCYLRLNKKQDADRVLKEYARLDAMDLDTAPLEYSLWAMPENVALRVKLARLYVKYGRKDLAAAQVALALEANPGNSGALKLREELQR